MKFRETDLAGVFIVELDVHADERGLFARTFDAAAFRARGLADRFDQQSLAQNTLAGTVRGLHYQIRPHGESKLVRATRGAIFDVAVDLRAGSPTFGRWVGVRLDEKDRRALYIPEGCAHGYQTLQNDTEALYLISGDYVPEAAAGVRFDDRSLGIPWPLAVTALSHADSTWPALGAATLP
ncbi:MAG: dTDP-4-dehydrorhamnose 3,5-epimerase [Vulcanimicrobiaceae bacterium]